MVDFVDFFQDLDRFGFTDALLPFLLVFTIVFAIFQKAKILGENKRNLNVVVAFILGMLTIMPHLTGREPDVVKIMNAALPQVSIVAVAIIMALLLIGILGGEAKWMGGSLAGWIALVAFGVIIYIFGSEAGWWEGIMARYGWWNSDTSSLIIIILVFAVVIWYITRDPTEAQKAGSFTKAMGEIGNMFGGKK
jgi:hypothetical protein